MKFHTPLRLVVIALMTIVLAAGCGRENVAPAEEAASDLPATAVPVEATPARIITLHPSIELIGKVVAIPERTAIVSPHIGRWVQTVHVVEGQHIKEGSLLLTLDSRIANIDRDRAAAVVDEKAAILTRMERGYLPQEKAMARHEMDKAAANGEFLGKKLNALADLRARNEVSPVEYQAVESSLRAARAAHAAAQDKFDLFEAGTRPAEISRAKAQLKSAQTDLAAAKLAVEFCRITSPIDGIVTNLSARQGTFVERATTVATIVDCSHLFGQVRIPGAYLSQVATGTQADVHFPSLPGQPLPGTVGRLSGQADPTTGDVDAFVTVPDVKGFPEHFPRDLMRPGLSCRIRLLLPEVREAIAVPTVAIADRSGTPVLTVVRQGKAYEIEVQLGVQTEDHVQVTAGVSPGELVITRGGYGLPAGCPVQVH